MPPALLKAQLIRIGKRLLRWRAEVTFMSCAAAILFVLCVFALSDLLIQLGRPARVTSWLVLMGATAGAVAWLARTLRARFTPQGVAAGIEKAFPQLDNHLINFLQFADDSSGNPFKQAYVRDGVPGWTSLEIKAMKNRRAHRRAGLALGVAAALLCLPTAFSGRAWAVAVWRIVNPFSDAQPLSLTRIVEVAPGDSSALQGGPLLMSCRVEGRAGHRAWIDVKPDDAEEITYALGRLEGGRIETFSHRVPKITTGLKYRFRAGDAPFPKWHRIESRPPLAFTRLLIDVLPPAYTGLDARRWDGLADDIEIPEGADVRVAAVANAALASAALAVQGGDPLPLSQRPDGHGWVGQLTLTNGSALTVSATDAYGGEMTAHIAYTLTPDRAPAIQIRAPQGRPILAPGAAPNIDFHVTDDYGLSAVSIERVVPGAEASSAGETLESWPIEAAADFSRAWRGPAAAAADQGVLAFRVVARDSHPGQPRVARSSTIIFNAVNMEQMASARDKQEKEAFATLAKLVDRQRENIGRTRSLRDGLDAATAEQWQETADRQKEVRELTRALLANPLQVLGNLTPTVKRLYANEMAQVIDVLASIPAKAVAEQSALATQSLNLEEKILRQLTFAEVAAAQTRVQQRVDALAGLLDALVKGETEVLTRTAEYVKTAAPVGDPLVSQQDNLAADLTEFTEACRREAASVEANDQTFAALLSDLAAQSDSDRIRDDMLLASENLDQNRPKAALPNAESALTKLKTLKQKFDAVQTAKATEKQEQMLEAVESARNRLAKVRALQQKAIESMDMVKAQRDASAEEVDLMEEEYEELLKNTKQVLLEIPIDLNVFSELNVANELVEDVFSVFEEVEQAAGSEKTAPGEVDEVAMAKTASDRTEMLEQMEKAEGRLDDLEIWLSSKPDTTKVTTETFDKEEMPESGIALGALPTQAEDIIGDLLDREEDTAEDADDGATTHALPDLEVGWDILEGDIASFAAKGKSGNERPDHKEQDGRSNVGRQGMSVGETAAGSGTINEGDENIEARRTQDPTQSGQVDLDGEADTKATGGGKLATGKADELGMAGGAKRMDSTEAGSMEGMEALMAKKAEELYAKASLKNVRADGFKDAAHHLRQAADAIAAGQPIEQIKELRNRAVTEMIRGKTQLETGTSGSLGDGPSTALLEGVVQGSPDQAPARYRDMVADYYKNLNESL